MLSIDQDALTAIQPELQPGESVLWAGRPSIRPIFHRNEDETLLPYSLMAGGFSLVWEIAVISSIFNHPTQVGWYWYVMAWFGLCFVAMGQYMMWGRFLYAARKKTRTYYAVTNQRVMVVQTYGDRQVASAEINSLPDLQKLKRSGEVGTIRFFAAPGPYKTTWREMLTLDDRFDVWDPLSIKRGPVFADLVDVDSAYQLISALRDQAIEAEVARTLRSRGSL